MRTLQQNEIKNVSGATFEGAIWGLIDGAATGMAIGGKWGGAGGFGFGGLAQLVGLIIPTIMGGVAGAAVGAMTDETTIAALVKEYRETFGPGNVSHTTI